MSYVRYKASKVVEKIGVEKIRHFRYIFLHESMLNVYHSLVYVTKNI